MGRWPVQSEMLTSPFLLSLPAGVCPQQSHAPSQDSESGVSNTETKQRTHLRGMEKTIHAASDSASRGVQGTVVAQFSCSVVFAEVLAT